MKIKLYKKGKILLSGNEAAGAAAIYAGCDCYYGYPITPQNELTSYMAVEMPKQKRIFIQAESEIAAISLVYGSAVAGKRAMTSSSSPGISLKQEGISYLAAAELPAVIINVQRGGPGLGNIAPAQSDYFQATRGGGHGDYRTIVLAPYSVQEIFDLTVKAFELADKYRIPVVILSDGLIGQTVEPIKIPDKPAPPPPPKPWALTGAKNRKPRLIRSLFLGDRELELHNYKLAKKYETIQKKEVMYKEVMTDDAEIIIVSYGSSARICEGVVKKARDNGFKVGLFRPVTVWPFPYKILHKICKNVKGVLVVEMSLGQMIDDVYIALRSTTFPIKFFGVPGGTIPTESTIYSNLISLFKKCSKRG